jgi:hypothetical protein
MRKERLYAVKNVIEIYNTRYQFHQGMYKLVMPWYSHRILFQSIDLYDRFLGFNDMTLTEEIADVYYYTCLYMSIKYFLTLPIPCSFTTVLPRKYHHPDYIKAAEDFEWYMLAKCLNFKVYRSTLYEAADFFGKKLSEDEIAGLLQKYCGCYIEGNSTKLFDLFAHMFPGTPLQIPVAYTSCGVPPTPSTPSTPPSLSSTTTTTTTTVVLGTTHSPGQENTSMKVIKEQIVPTSGPVVTSSMLPTSQALLTVIPGQQTMRGAPEPSVLL